MELTDPCQQVVFGVIFLHRLLFCWRNEYICFHNDVEEKEMAFHAGTRINCIGWIPIGFTVAKSSVAFTL